MEQQFQRTVSLIGEEAVNKLQGARVIVFGLGGVGSYVCEALARSGVGSIDIVDKDEVDITNLNRQIIATHDTIGMLKTQAMKERLRSINPEIKVLEHPIFFLPETKRDIDFTSYDYIVDAVDIVTAKLALVECAKEAEVPIISSMGTGNKLDPTALEVADISKTSVCPLAKVMRRELKKRGIYHLKVVYSKEEPVKRPDAPDPRTPSSIAFMPSVAGLIIAGEVIKDLIKDER